ncbi:hypothetical protein [Azotobacter vinelandii]|uniref:hypothetical protein n=1 Tax=Azotobacter vinelandii TaxID=354 RepID=UPI000915DF6D|nr:hypothetical protein [Azotobacter vinelandii]WKN23208.1 hypothetical protein AVAEIV_001245 [Azotobacter vinelandii]SFY07913.1 hypothetical protein SAMN04244547_03888 [Azotobacter vinelandii]
MNDCVDIPKQCVVRFDGAGFFTNTVKGKRASCSWSDEEAAKRLANRLFGEGHASISKLPSQPGDDENRIYSRWLLVGRSDPQPGVTEQPALHESGEKR